MSAAEVKRTGYSKIYKAAVTSDFQAMVHEELQRQRKRVAALEQLLEWARDPEMAQFFVANAVALDGGCKTAVGSDLEPTEEVEKPPEASSGTPSGGEQAPNSGSGEATDCVCPAGKAHTLACIAARVEAGCEHFETRYQEAKASAEAIDCAGMPSWAELHELYPDRSTPEWAKEQIERAERYRRGIEAEMALLAIENTTKIVGGA